MDAKHFFELVETMRYYQQRFFKDRKVSDLRQAQRYEQSVDFEIARTRRIVGPRKDPITMVRLFNEKTDEKTTGNNERE